MSPLPSAPRQQVLEATSKRPPAEHGNGSDTQLLQAARPEEIDVPVEREQVSIARLVRPSGRG